MMIVNRCVVVNRSSTVVLRRNLHSHKLESCEADANNKEKIDFRKFFKDPVLDLLFKRRFLDLSSSDDVTIGLLGKEVKRNISFEWRRSAWKEKWKLVEDGSSWKGKTILAKVCDVIRCHGTADTPDPSTSRLAIHFTEPDVINPDARLAMVKFVDTSSAEMELENFHSKRIWWLKKYLRKPAEVRSGWESNPDDQIREVTARYGDDLPVQHTTMIPPGCLPDGGWALPPSLRSNSILISHHQTNNLLAMVLTDSFHAVRFPNYDHTMMRVHPHLAPVKTFLSIDGEATTTLRQLASEMTDWLRQMGVSCWNTVESGMDHAELDESGVPYGIVLSPRTLDDGILCVRNRDSSLKIETHVSELIPKLKLYLRSRASLDVS